LVHKTEKRPIGWGALLSVLGLSEG
jgi:hypothetical protein